MRFLRKSVFLLIVFSLPLLFNCSTSDKSFLTQTDIFISGTSGYDTFRIPSIIVTSNGTILAFCEGRKGSRGDSGDIDIVLKRSEDQGKTWSDVQVVWDDAENTCGNPCAVVDQQTGVVWLLLTHNLGIDKEPQIIDQTSTGSRTIWVTKSENDGETWSQPEEITQSVKLPNWTWYATGPGAGIQLKNGKLIIPCDHIEAETKKYYSHIFYSDDHGQTWQLGGSTPTDQVNECEVVELENGTLYLNTRNYDRSQKTRAFSYSKDQGLTWSEVKHDSTLIEPICQASTRRFTLKDKFDKNRILFSNPASKDNREKMTIRMSYDESKTWAVSKILHEGSAAYSCLTILPDMSIACFYERGNEHAYEKITFAKFNVDWLSNGKDSLKSN
jgi:sialidase-1